MPGELEGLRVDDVDIRWRNSQDDAVRLGDVLRNEVTCLLLDIRRLISNGNLQLDR